MTNRSHDRERTDSSCDKGRVGACGGEGGNREKASVIEDAEVARYDLVFQHGASWNINPISVVGDDDDGAL